MSDHRQASQILSASSGESEAGNKFLYVDLAGVPWDKVAITYPTPETELLTFSLEAVTKRTVLVTYTDSTKEFISQIERSV